MKNQQNPIRPPSRTIIRLFVNLLIFGIIFIAALAGSGCSLIQKTPVKQKIVYIEPHYADCGSLNLSDLNLQLEDPKESPGSLKNQKIISSNMALLQGKLLEADSIIKCYETQRLMYTDK